MLYTTVLQGHTSSLTQSAIVSGTIKGKAVSTAAITSCTELFVSVWPCKTISILTLVYGVNPLILYVHWSVLMPSTFNDIFTEF